MNILFLCDSDPRKTNYGGAQRTNAMWRALQKVGNVYCLTFDQQFETQEIAPNIWHVKKLYRVNFLQFFCYRLERKLILPLHVLPLWPLPTNIEKSVSEIFPDIAFDIVVCRYFFDMVEMHLWKYPRIYVDIDDHPLEMFNMLNCKDVKPYFRPLSRWILKRQIAFLEKKITGGWISNPEQANGFRTKESIVPLKNIALPPSNLYNAKCVRKPILISIGAMNYYPNYQGVDIFLNNVWPIVHQEYPQLEFMIIGKGTPMEYTKKWKRYPNVIQLGFVENLEQVYQYCLASVVSIFSGGGTCIKTLESLSYSRVCLSTPFGARGLEHEMEKSNIGLYTYHSSEDFISLLNEQVLNAENRIRNESAAAAYIKNNHSYHSFEETILNTIKK